MNNSYRRSANKERQLVKYLRDNGWFALRTPASKGGLDVIAHKHDPTDKQACPTCHRLPTQVIEVKSGSKSTPWSLFPPADRKKLIEVAKQIGGEKWAVPWLAWFPLGEGMVEVSKSLWP